MSMVDTGKGINKEEGSDRGSVLQKCKASEATPSAKSNLRRGDTVKRSLFVHFASNNTEP